MRSPIRLVRWTAAGLLATLVMIGCMRDDGDEQDPLSWLFPNAFAPAEPNAPPEPNEPGKPDPPDGPPKPKPPGLVGISISPTELYFDEIGQTEQLSVVAGFSDGSTLDVTAAPETRFSSNQEAIVAVDRRGVATALSEGEAKITVGYRNVRTSITAQVELPPPNPATLIALDARPAQLNFVELGASLSIQVIGEFSDGQQRDLTADPGTRYESADPAVASASPGGTVTALSPGSTQVVVTNAGREDVVQVSVAPPPVELVELRISPTDFVFGEPEERLQLFVTGVYSDGSERDLTLDPAIRFNSDNLDAISVSQSGQAAPVAAGRAVVVATDGSLTASATLESTLCRPPAPQLDPHASLLLDDRVVISGLAPGAQEIEIVGGAVPLLEAVVDGTFAVEAPLRPNQVNLLQVTAIAACGSRSSPRPTSVANDNQAPRIFIDYPADAAEIVGSATVVTGRVSDLLSGASGLGVTVNGIPAAVEIGIGTNGTFVARDVPLQASGATQLLAIASDAAGNQAGASVTVLRREPPSEGARLVVLSGDGQSGSAMHALGEPLTVRVERADGAPIPGKLVTFRVTRSDGRLSGDPGQPGQMVYQTFADAEGVARAFWMLGSDAGHGNNRVEVVSRDVAGSATLSASAAPGAPVQVNIGMGNNQRGEAGGPAIEPLRAWVNDGCNGVGDVPVSFWVTRGNGRVAGADFVTVRSTRTGHVEVPFTYGPDRGNNEVEVWIPGEGTGRAVFTLFGEARSEEKLTSVAGQVLDNSSQPLGGAGIRLLVGGGLVASGQSDNQGNFELHVEDPLIAGAADLFVDAGSISWVAGQPVPETTRFPDMHFLLTIVPNAENALPTPVKLPRLESVNDREYDGSRTTDLELTCEGIEGLKMVILAGTTITLPDGRRVGPDDPGSLVLSINQVHFDEIPMPMPDGAAPPFAWTFQPGGAKFDIPVRVEYPNMMALPAGAVGNFLSFDHDTNRFEIIATGTVSADGSVLSTDRGVGIITSGWGGTCPPYPPTGNAEGAGDGGGDEPENCSEADCEQEPPPCTGGEGGGDTGAGCDDDNKGSSQGGSCGNDQTDPVNLHSGEFAWDEEDLRIPGRGFDFVWKRTYRSRTRLWNPATTDGPIRSAARTSAFGVNWDHSYNIQLVVSPPATPAGTMWLCDGTGRIDSYRPNGAGAWTSTGFFRSITLNESDGTYTLTHPNQTKVTFAQPPSQANFFVTRIEDRNGNEMLFYYDDRGRLASILDTLSRPITLLYDEEDRLVSLKDHSGREVRYEYSPTRELAYEWREGPAAARRDGRLVVEGDLVSVTRPAIVGTPNGNDFPDGQRTAYEYSQPSLNEQANHNLTAIMDARGRVVVRNEYETRHISRFGVRDLSRNDGHRFAADLISFSCGIVIPDTLPMFCWRAMVLPDPGYERAAQGFADLVTRCSDRVVSHTWGDEGQTVTIAYGAARPITNGQPGGRRTTVTDRNGNVTVYHYDGANRLVAKDEKTRGLRPEDPAAFTTRWEYNSEGRVAAILHPNGNETRYVYESDLNPDALPTQRGNLREVRHRPGFHKPAGDQAEIVEQFEYLQDAGGCCGFNFITRYVDGRGNETRYEYDERGNRIRAIHAIPAIVEEWEYNEFGQMTARVHPDNGSGHQRRDEFVYHESGPQTGYLAQSISDTGGFNLVTRYEYDAVGNLIRRVDPDGNDTRFEVNARNQVVRANSRPPNPAVPFTRYIRDFYYDANGNLVRSDVLNLDEEGRPRANLFLTSVYEYDTLNKLIGVAREKGDFDDEIPGTHDAPRIDELPPEHFVVARFAYDANRNLTQAVSGEAAAGRQPENVVQILYDERNRPFRVTGAAGAPEQSTSQLDYDGNGNIVRVTSGLEGEQHVATWTYDGFDRLVSNSDPMGNETRRTYDAASNVVRQLRLGELLDAPGAAANVRLAETTHVFDPLNRRTRTARAFFDPASQADVGDGLAAMDYVWSDISRLLSVTNDNGHATTYAYDTANRLSRVTDAKANTTTYTYDELSNVTRITEVEKSDLGAPDETFVTSIAYDGVNRRTQVVDNIGHTQRYAYDSRGNLVRHTDARGNVIRREFDGLNRLLGTIRTLTDTGDGGGQPVDEIVTSQTWDDNSRVTSRTDDNGNSTLYEFDALDRLIAEIMADDTEHVFTYDVHGNRVTSLDANGSRVTSTYDDNDRLIANAVERGPGVLGTTAESFAYDGLSRLTRAQDDDSVVTRAYDSLSNLALETQNGQNVACTFDGVGNLTSCRYPGGRLITHGFDELERKKTISDEDGLIADYAFVGPRRVLRRDNGNNTRMTIGYDAGRRVTSTTHTRDPDGAAEIIDARTYTWDAMNNKTQRRDIRAGGPGLTHDYSYDSVNRLIQTRVTDPQDAVQRLTRYVLDGVHNRIRVEGAPDDGEYVGEYTLDDSETTRDRAVNQYTTTPFDERTYDANGNLRTRERVSGADQLKYDFRNRLVEFEGAQSVRSAYVYDALGRRTRTIVGVGAPSPHIVNVLLNGWQEIEEQDGAGATTATYTFGRYVDEVIDMHRSGVHHYYHSDHLYNVGTISTSSGAVTERYEYQDFGDSVILDPSGNALPQSMLGNPFMFQGRRLDLESSEYHFRTRQLSTSAGRFTTRDRKGAWHDERSLGSAIAFVAHNPLSYVDPFGQEASDWVEGILGIGAAVYGSQGIVITLGPTQAGYAAAPYGPAVLAALGAAYGGVQIGSDLESRFIDGWYGERAAESEIGKAIWRALDPDESADSDTEKPDRITDDGAEQSPFVEPDQCVGSPSAPPVPKPRPRPRSPQHRPAPSSPSLPEYDMRGRGDLTFTDD